MKRDLSYQKEPAEQGRGRTYPGRTFSSGPSRKARLRDEVGEEGRSRAAGALKAERTLGFIVMC